MLGPTEHCTIRENRRTPPIATWLCPSPMDDPLLASVRSTSDRSHSKALTDPAAGERKTPTAAAAAGTERQAHVQHRPLVDSWFELWKCASR
ncbi:succinyl CoA synthetase-like protein [Anopheles sinensis]|uniref:Succinyl CoA synthetase-like protein n=1 Tax=Anopheles sinensis TaxID=74873 RepID=A0A084VGV1_ANOSI|nr:succinyl CoA synthetase-like protein [Anopheles sinensis]